MIVIILLGMNNTLFAYRVTYLRKKSKVYESLILWYEAILIMLIGNVGISAKLPVLDM